MRGDTTSLTAIILRALEEDVHDQSVGAAFAVPHVSQEAVTGAQARLPGWRLSLDAETVRGVRAVAGATRIVGAPLEPRAETQIGKLLGQMRDNLDMPPGSFLLVDVPPAFVWDAWAFTRDTVHGTGWVAHADPTGGAVSVTRVF